MSAFLFSSVAVYVALLQKISDSADSSPPTGRAPLRCRQAEEDEEEKERLERVSAFALDDEVTAHEMHLLQVHLGFIVSSGSGENNATETRPGIGYSSSQFDELQANSFLDSHTTANQKRLDAFPNDLSCGLNTAWCGPGQDPSKTNYCLLGFHGDWACRRHDACAVGMFSGMLPVVSCECDQALYDAVHNIRKTLPFYKKYFCGRIIMDTYSPSSPYPCIYSRNSSFSGDCLDNPDDCYILRSGKGKYTNYTKFGYKQNVPLHGFPSIEEALDSHDSWPNCTKVFGFS